MIILYFKLLYYLYYTKRKECDLYAIYYIRMYRDYYYFFLMFGEEKKFHVSTRFFRYC